ncbi:swi/snf chromatin-remodeling complex subunit snf5 [Anaeramoeba flamelloides]|uniref:Swi/snf chromatin-remodeling complex subunit snf5 n=1 Tax=Anaeramoeba flamelloides TaxID=1746091 RepID=A0ABQ8Y6W2_9EUKA|nr:swi/snf chromatin-remodeling complex subunit snf5 [Anaeramoeba flamelloides]
MLTIFQIVNPLIINPQMDSEYLHYETESNYFNQQQFHEQQQQQLQQQINEQNTIKIFLFCGIAFSIAIEFQIKEVVSMIFSSLFSKNDSGFSRDKIYHQARSPMSGHKRAFFSPQSQQKRTPRSPTIRHSPKGSYVVTTPYTNRILSYRRKMSKGVTEKKRQIIWSRVVIIVFILFLLVGSIIYLIYPIIFKFINKFLN